MNRVLCLKSKLFSDGSWVLPGDVVYCKTPEDAARILETTSHFRLLSDDEEPFPWWVRLLNKLVPPGKVRVDL